MDICKHDKIDFEFKKVNDDDSAINISNKITCSCQLLDTVIEDATNNKKTLDSTMDGIISLIKQVECTEKAAEQAKEEAATSSLDTLAKAEELKQARQRVKEANDTHAKEVYAQKLVLDTKVKELKLRVLEVLNQGGTSLAVLIKMRNALEKRMTSALREKEFADKVKLEKESLAEKALADEENQLNKVKEMSERLKVEVVKNSKLQQFLVDRGHVVDMLDGDVSDKIKDVNLLKESLDQAVSLGEMLSSTQISSIVSEMPCLTNEMSKERNMPANSDVDLEKISTFGSKESANKNVQSATQKPSEREKSIVVPQEHELLSKMSNLKLDKHEGNKNVTFYADKNDETVSEKSSLTNATS
ncbi:uncharacterized protein [Rutidosis leptorrhynchoides]|uniref:uncharacterized protein n=1 Tax=Rutidosis leptorrhynchoides TaxID=125765 RepID=UPI003A993D51